LILSNSRRDGEEIRLATDRMFLLRAAQMRFNAVHFTDHNTPAVCQDDRRTYAWALLAKEGVVPPDENATVIQSPTAPGTSVAKQRPPVHVANHISQQERPTTMKSTSSSTVARKTTLPQPPSPRHADPYQRVDSFPQAAKAAATTDAIDTRQFAAVANRSVTICISFITLLYKE
jgi:hypothetical protein